MLSSNGFKAHFLSVSRSASILLKLAYSTELYRAMRMANDPYEAFENLWHVWLLLVCKQYPVRTVKTISGSQEPEHKVPTASRLN
jgi:hypothetical protein